MNGIIFRNSQVAFNNALDKKVFDKSKKSEKYIEVSYVKEGSFYSNARTIYIDENIGDWMYMHSQDNKDFFKNKNTRKYIEVYYK
tara:strand:- start:17 stop:271 length:255 start_codon:yes stop_codon:yes gene_type:complete